MASLIFKSPQITSHKKPLSRNHWTRHQLGYNKCLWDYSAVKYERADSLHLADALSPAALPHPITAQVQDFDVFRMEIESDCNARNPRLTESLEQLCEETSKDTTLNTLYKVIVNGWPADRTDIPESLHPCWNYGDELSVKNGIIYKDAKVMVPQSM